MNNYVALIDGHADPVSNRTCILAWHKMPVFKGLGARMSRYTPRVSIRQEHGGGSQAFYLRSRSPFGDEQKSLCKKAEGIKIIEHCRQKKTTLNTS